MPDEDNNGYAALDNSCNNSYDAEWHQEADWQAQYLEPHADHAGFDPNYRGAAGDVQVQKSSSNFCSPCQCCDEGEEVEKLGTGHFYVTDDWSTGLEERVEVETAIGWYAGQWRGEKFEGQGHLKRFDLSEYHGSFHDGHAHGPGVMWLNNGHTYDGEWCYDLAHGYGVYQTSEGEYYKGEWKDNLKSGAGFQAWADGMTYEGEFWDDAKHGEGVFCQKPGDIRYRGQFERNRMHGYGHYVFDNGRTYEGDWNAGQMHGKGVMLWPDGCRYEGEFYEGLRQGEGDFTSIDDTRYVGQWNAGKQHGLGATINPEGKQLKGRWANGSVVERHNESTAHEVITTKKK